MGEKFAVYTYCTGAYTCFHIFIETDLSKSPLCAFEQKQEGTVEGGGEKSEKGPLCTAAIYQARVGKSRPYIVNVGPSKAKQRQAASRQVTLVYTSRQRTNQRARVGSSTAGVGTMTQKIQTYLIE